MSGQELRALEKVLDIVCAARKHQWPIDPVIPVPPPAPVGPTPPPPAPTPAVAPGVPQDPYYYGYASDILKQKNCGGATKSGYCYHDNNIGCSQGSVQVKRCAGVTGATTACINQSNQFSTPPPFGCFSKTQYLGLAGSSADDEQQPPMY